MNLPTTLSLCLLYLPTFVRASSAVPPIEKATQSSLVLSSNTRPDASSASPSQNLSLTYYASNISSNAPDIPPPIVLPSLPKSSSAITPSPITQHPSSTYTLGGLELTPTSIEGVTKNTKTTTSQGGHRTILPIIFCPRCGGRHGKSWIIHPPRIHPPGGIKFHIPGLKWPFTVTPDGDPKPLDPSEPEPEPDDDDAQSTSNESNSEARKTDGTTSESASTSHSTSSSSSSSSSSQVSGTEAVATSINVDPYATEIPQDQIAEIQSYLGSLFAAELDQLGTTLEPMTTTPAANATTTGSPNLSPTTPAANATTTGSPNPSPTTAPPLAPHLAPWPSGT